LTFLFTSYMSTVRIIVGNNDYAANAVAVAHAAIIFLSVV